MPELAWCSGTPDSELFPTENSDSLKQGFKERLGHEGMLSASHQSFWRACAFPSFPETPEFLESFAASLALLYIHSYPGLIHVLKAG